MPKSSSRFLALVRGINVGGKNLIAKDDLRHLFEDLGFTNVRTYIQSGNILFRSERTSVKALTAAIEAALSDRFAYEAQAVILSHQKYSSSVGAAPKEWGKDDSRKHNALFTLDGTTPQKVLAQLPAPKKGIETVVSRPGVLFWSYSKAQQGRTTIMELAKKPIYKQLTVRNHNTVFKLLALFDEV